jgi:hypothetical protein
MPSLLLSYRRWLSPLLVVIALVLPSEGASAQSDPPLRAGSLCVIDGSVAYAPPGQTEWRDAFLNRTISTGDRLWTDRGGRAELHLGSSVLHMDSEAFVELAALDQDVFQASLNQGRVNLRVRSLRDGENVEIDTTQLAFRATRPGDYRIEVDPDQRSTRVTVRNGLAQVYGASGQALQLRAGPQYAFTGRDLSPVAAAAGSSDDDFGRWAAERNRQTDLSASARYLPIDVVGYSQLDSHGSWVQDPVHGWVWYPRVKPADWAPYRYGRWDWVAPWGWTWADESPWGFAPFHYGRWTQINSHWAWVPGRLETQPVYSSALVVFLGAVAGNLEVGSDASIGWFPLAPGEAWRPNFRSSVAYLRNVNRFVAGTNIASGTHINQDRLETMTAARLDDFVNARPLRGRWRKLKAADLARFHVIVPPGPWAPAVDGRAARLN